MKNLKLQRLTGKIILSVILIVIISCSKEPQSDLSKGSMIPKPAVITPTGEYFTVKTGTGIYIHGDSEELYKTGEVFAEMLRKTTGYEIKVQKAGDSQEAGNIYLNLNSNETGNGKEGYVLEITKKLVTVTASHPAGIFYGVQTLRQLFPAEIESGNKSEAKLKIPTGMIGDAPEYSYRGSMLDVARHFFSVEDVKRYIDFLALYKMNTLHLHLSDDQGWRIEIKSWPNLAQHGGSTEVGGGEGGFYTQEQYKDIVKYAQERYVTIIPEIDMPGHTNAALASYAELNCNGKATELYTGTEVGFSTLCTKKDITYKFVDDVIRELAELTPGEFIHIGGDESHATKREDYIPFVEKVQDIVISHGKRVLGWDDIAISSLRPNAVSQVWASVKNANLAVGQGGMILMSPASKAYLDMKYDKETKLGLHWAGYIEVDTAYLWDPATFIPGVGKEKIIGIEAALWSETVTNIDEVEFMVFPRLPGYAEIGWTKPALRNWDEYKVRLSEHGQRFKNMGIDYYASPVVPWK